MTASKPGCHQPKITPLEPPYPEDLQSIFDAIMPPGMAPLALFRTLATSPRAWKKFRAASLLDAGPLELRDREIVILRVSALSGCEYEWGVHAAIFAPTAGLTPQEVQATSAYASNCPIWTQKEAMLLRSIEALHEHSAVASADFDELATHFNHEQILEILMLAGFYKTVAFLANSLGLPAEPFAQSFPQAPATSNTCDLA